MDVIIIHSSGHWQMRSAARVLSITWHLVTKVTWHLSLVTKVTELNH